MTDGWLMDAECVHGNVWHECQEPECKAPPSFPDEYELLERIADALDELNKTIRLVASALLKLSVGRRGSDDKG